MKSPLSENQNTGILIEAVWFASQRHTRQRRKDEAQTPYINHPLDVLHILWFEGGVRDLNALTAAVLHDTLEDTDTQFEELVSRFGELVARIVAEVTDDTTLPKAERKQRQVDSAPHKSREAKLVKLGDKISNLRDIQKNAPVGWSKQRVLEYVAWSRRVVAGLRGVNPTLEKVFDEITSQFPEH